MKPKLNKILSLPRTGLKERKIVETIKFTCQEKKLIRIWLSGLVFPGVVYQFFDLTDRADVNDFNLRGVRQTRSQALDLSGKNVRLSSPPSSKNLLEDDWTLKQKQYLTGEVGENCLIEV